MLGKVIILLLLFISFLALRIFLHFSSHPSLSEGDFLKKDMVLFSNPTNYTSYQQFSFIYDSGQRVLVRIDSREKVEYGDTVFIKGKVEERKIGEDSILVLNQPQIIVKKAAEMPVLALLSDIRQRIARLYQNALPQNSSSLLLGMVFGIKDNMDPTFEDSLEKVGVTHVVAASGMNISIIAGFFAVTFSRLFHRKTSLALTIGAIVIYAILSGLGPSIIRASIMGSIAFSAQILGRQNKALLALLLTIFVMLLISPAIIFDIGFQLSALSTLGIVLLNPIFEAKLKQNILVKIVGTDFFTTISAQIATLPIIIANFGTYFLPSIIVNLLVLWTIPVLMTLGGISALLGFIFKSAAVIVIYSSYPLLIYFQEVVEFFARLEFEVKISQLAWEIGIGYYLILSAAVLRFKK